MSTSKKKSRKRSKKARARRRRRIILFTVEILVLVVMLGALWVVVKSDKIQKDDIFQKGEDKIAINDELEAKKEEAGDEWHMTGYKNVALFGVDSRDKNLGKGTRTDTIMIASINEDTGDVKLVSVFRDTYINIGNDTYNKANAAYAAGGPEQAIMMLNMCLDLDITDYATVDFTALVDAIDALGGVDINVTEEEIEYLNSYQISMVGKPDGTVNALGEPNYVADAGTDYTPVTNAGMQRLNGLQATAYCRIRYVGSDFQRAERQRTVLIEAAKRAKETSVSSLNNIIDEVFPKVKTSFTTTELLGYAAKAASYNIVGNMGFPVERVTGKMGKAGSCVVATDFEAEVVNLHTFLFGESTYETTNVVREVSARVAGDRATYLGN